MRWLSGKSDDLPEFHSWDHLVELVLLSPLTHVCAYIQYISTHIININKPNEKQVSFKNKGCNNTQRHPETINKVFRKNKQEGKKCGVDNKNSLEPRKQMTG